MPEHRCKHCDHDIKRDHHMNGLPWTGLYCRPCRRYCSG